MTLAKIRFLPNTAPELGEIGLSGDFFGSEFQEVRSGPLGVEELKAPLLESLHESNQGHL